MPNLPGLTLSILRQDTRTPAGRPVLMSGRLTAFGLGLPALIRVILEGPSYNPEQVHFDTFASPFTGDYSVQVLAQKDGEYQVYAQAFPVPIPTGPLLPESLLLLPSVAESAKPPLVVGAPVSGGVSAQLPTGSQFIPAPAPTPIEIAVTVGAPSVIVTLPGAGAPVFGGLPFIPQPPAAPAPTEPQPIPVAPPPTAPAPVPTAPAPPVAPPPTVPTAPTPSGDLGYGFFAWGEPRNWWNIPGATSPETAKAILAGAALPTVPTALPVPTAPSVPTFPGAPTASMLGTPVVNLPQQITIGSNWEGNVQVPTIISQAPAGFIQLPTGDYRLPTYVLQAQLFLEDPSTLQLTPAGSAYQNVRLGDTLNIPVGFNTSNLKEARYNVFLRVKDGYGATLFDGIINRLYAMGAALPPGVEIPTYPTSAMLGVPLLNAPAQVNYGQNWNGSVSIPTMWPAGVPVPPTLPNYLVNLIVVIDNGAGIRRTVESRALYITPGQQVSFSWAEFNTAEQAANVGDYTVFLYAHDQAGTPIFGAPIGSLRIV